MFAPSNELTIKSWRQRWLSNIVENLNIHPVPVSLSALHTKVNHHVSMVFGAGPSLRKLQKRAHLIPSHWGLLVTDHALKAVIEAGLKPTLVITMDGEQDTEPVILEGFDLLAKEYPETPVLIDLVCCPSIVERVKTPFFWRTGPGDTKYLMERYIRRECSHLTRLGHGGNVGSVAMIMAKFVCYSRHVVLMGLDFAMREGTTRGGYWYPREMPDRHQYVDVVDIYGRPLVTMANLHNYKWWSEHFCATNNDVEWIIANDGGYLGVHSPTHNFDHYTYLPLDKAVEHLADELEDD
jgi:hypothetical protein